ncbi:uncharacterized protein LOC132715201 [Ruditapes philippinarum]|uniref:uncharacterized protein LOC132715201 n=1 Tax=Ruditapes philippinarum TaxID=129788 RepID=UPI00295B27CB|nr:uncharacterized protein LOC132715201 [Ruditapes philippinarum]
MGCLLQTQKPDPDINADFDTLNVAAIHFSTIASADTQKHIKFVEGRDENLEDEFQKLKTQQCVPTEVQAPSNVNQEVPRQLSTPDTNVLTEELGDDINVQKFFPDLVYSIDTMPFCDHLYAKDILTHIQMDTVQQRVRLQDHRDANRELLMILITKRPEKAVMIEVLYATQQQHLLKLFYPRP